MAKAYWDKGHGGSDPGAVGQGLQEKVLTRKIVDYGMAYLKGYEVEQRCSRNGDETKSLKQRTDEANSWGANLLVSVHINSATSTSANGFESHIYPNAGAPTIAFQNILHAEIMQVMRAFGVTTDRGKKQSNFHMLRECKSKMVSCLTENLFIVNSFDANRLKQEEFLKAVGEAHARGVAKYLGLKEKQSEPYKVIIPNTAFWQAKGLVIEFQERGYECKGVNLKLYGIGKQPEDNDPYQFVIFTDYTNAVDLVIELQTRGYDRTYGEKI
ncbi:N-acetylmuramoyl-L-alanine amidase [Neobacillus niacini]|uniref:N-acetylmuramoyl-L-alanine amidase n=1 Tax=Neobacillus niacini TaxID=86668 RepID=UPI002FFD8F60